MTQVYSWLKTIVIFMIFLNILSNLLGKSDFKKYVNVVTGLLLVLVVMNPILKLLSADDKFDYYFDSISFDLETTEVGNEMKDAQEGQRQIILGKYKEEIRKQIESLLEKEDLRLIKAEITIDEDETSEDYASIKKLNVVATYYAKEYEEVTNKINIEINKIIIGDNSEEQQSETEETEFLSPMEIHIKNILSDFYNMKEDNINISIQGG